MGSLRAPLLALLSMVLVLTACSSSKTSSSASIPEVDIPFTRYVLPNGLTLIVHEDHKTPIVAVNIWYHVGSKDERPGKTGFAHLFEHLMFQGSENHNDEYFRPLLDAGATDMNGTTAEDRTNYFQNVPTPALDRALWLESDRMGHLLGVIDKARLDEQRGVVQNEKRQRENAPYGKVWELMAPNTYPASHPYSWTTIGSMADLDAASLDDVREWFKRFYGAANAVLVVAGDVKPEEVKAKVEKYFADIPSGPPVPHQVAWVAKMRGEHRQVMEDRVPQARVYKTWNVPEKTSDAATELQVVSQLLAGGKNSRLYKRLVYTDQIATDVTAALDDREIGSQFIIWATARPGVDLATVEKTLDEEMRRFLKNGPTQKELDRARTSLFAGFLRSTERIGGFGGKSEILASGQIYAGRPDAFKQDLEVLRRATPARLKRVAREWLSDGVYVLEVRPFPAYSASATGADRSSMPEAGAAQDLRLPKFQRATLKNGLKVVLAERHSAPVVELSLVMDAGYAADSLGKLGTAKLAIDMLDEGTSTRSALEISSDLESLGANLGGGSSLDSSAISLSAIRSLLDPALGIYADVILNPAFPQAELDRLRQQYLAAIEQERASPATMAMRTLAPLVYGPGHAYGIPLTGTGTAQSIKSMTAADLRRFHDTWIRPDNATLVAVGDVTLKDLLPMLERHLGGWRKPSTPLPRKNLGSVALPASPRIFLLDRPGAEQSVIMAGEVAPPFEVDGNVPLETLNELLGGMFTSRLNMNLREAKHWSYGARSSLTQAKGQQPFFIRAPVQSDRTADSMREILAELRGVTSDPPPSAVELLAAQNSLTRTLPGEHETNGAVAGTLAQSVIFDLPDDYYTTYVSRVRGLQATDLQQAARGLVHPEGLTWVIVGDVAKIEAPVRALGLGEVKIIDADGKILR